MTAEMLLSHLDEYMLKQLHGKKDTYLSASPKSLAPHSRLVSYTVIYLFCLLLYETVYGPVLCMNIVNIVNDKKQA